MAAPNNLDAGHLDQSFSPITADDLKPPECAGLPLTEIVTGSGRITGTPGNDLLLGSAGPDEIDGRPGDDCLLGGAGNDTLDGGPGTDVCLGGSGANVFRRCETTIS